MSQSARAQAEDVSRGDLLFPYTVGSPDRPRAVMSFVLYRRFQKIALICVVNTALVHAYVLT